MVIDSSIFVAIFLAEETWELLIEEISKAPEKSISAFTYVETAVVIDKKLGEDGVSAFKHFIDEAKINIIEVTADIASEAFLAYRKFGKGNHKAGLNLGDVFSYATAKLTGNPLFFKGDDFALTDIAMIRADCI